MRYVNRYQGHPVPNASVAIFSCQPGHLLIVSFLIIVIDIISERMPDILLLYVYIINKNKRYN